MLLSEVKVGDRLIADGGFTCLEEGRVCEVKVDADGDLYVDCQGSLVDVPVVGGRYVHPHLLSGQEDEDGTLIGLERMAS